MKLCGFEAGIDQPLFLIAGPCVIESETLAIETAGRLQEITAALGMSFIYKSSFDKANRSSWKSFRGPGLDAGLRILETVKSQLGVPVLTDVHEDTPLQEVAAVVDVLQTPAFLCRQTNFIQNVARQGKPVNIKKGQFLSPWDMKNVSDKAQATGTEQIMVCERGGDAQLRGARGVRCHAFGTAAGRPGGKLRRTAGIRSGAGACRRCGRHLRSLHGNPPPPGRGAE
jgi:2-dehydro-3-deoxyphosphooctonate aldolase (KDO 8-P synthase)